MIFRKLFYGSISCTVSILLCIAFSLFGMRAVKVEAPVHEGVFLPVIMYHSVVENGGNGDYIIDAADFEKDMKYLEANGFKSVSIAQLVDYVYADGKLPEKPVMITFDDGFENNLTVALPVLEKYDMCGIVSVVGEFTEKAVAENDPNPAYAYCTWDDIRAMSECGRLEIGNHTDKMHSISNGRRGCAMKWNESLADYADAFETDIGGLQQKIIENSEITPIVFAYPYGSISRESIPILKKMGFKATFICYEKPNYITKTPNTLFGLNRYNRASYLSTEEFMRRALKP